MALTFLDAGVLIAAFKGGTTQADRAIRILDDGSREFAASVFLRLEVLPKPVYERRRTEIEFYESFFRSVALWATVDAKLIDTAYDAATKHGLAAMDALHVAAAELLGVSEFVTTESPTKPLFRIRSMRISSIRV